MYNFMLSLWIVFLARCCPKKFAHGDKAGIAVEVAFLHPLSPTRPTYRVCAPDCDPYSRGMYSEYPDIIHNGLFVSRNVILDNCAAFAIGFAVF
ncbi:MAG: hypothetical protein C4527_14855 [Candidatus Omnitrophota bacterium]|jgi:hypothetical protein|nr:MAG: hypothetical protein C4527_14855 [Candidatus Omnitrophota bacterium]